MAATTTLPVLFGTGVHASRPAASAVGSGGLYSCTTHSLIYQTDGVSTWTTWGTLGGTAVTDATISTSDVTTNNVSITKHGWAPKGDNNAAHYLDGTGAYSTPAGSSGATISRLGKTAIGASTIAGASVGAAKKITLSATGVLLSINVYVDMTTDQGVDLWAAVYSDSAGVPSRVLAAPLGANNGSTGGPPLWMETGGGSGFAARWVAFPIGLYLASGDYWIVAQFNGTGSPRFYYDTGGSDYNIAYSGFGWGDSTRINTQTTTTRDHSLYAVILT